MNRIIKKDLQESISITNYAIKNQIKTIEGIAEVIIDCLERGNKVILFGNGGSAADAQHIAAELIGRFEKNRKALAAISLTTNTSIISAIANDFGYSHVFSKQIEGLGQAGDVAIGISTSGSSKNVLEALKKARQLGLATVGFCGKASKAIFKVSDLTLSVNSLRTCRIQEMHIKIGHIICGLVEKALLNEK
ncbi:MAG: D-sedoheptulose 7-phosphate isomerase [Candidatus Omnitrophica bacterium]|nr:D-sedoheptulose 7-phosphate isomerase [Candidatus Omnitrophota bacterium]